MSPNIPGLSSMNWTGLTADIMYWLGYGLVMVLILAGFVAVYFLMGYRYKVTIMERRGMGHKDKDGKVVHSVGRVVKDRAKVVKHKGVEKWRLMMARKSIQPPEYDSIYPGNKVFLYRTGPEDFFPVKFSCSNPSASFTPMPQHIKRWQQLEIQQAAEDYAKDDAWSKYGNTIIMMGTVMFCLILVGVTVYYTYQHANQVVPALQGLTGAVKNNNLIAGI